MPLFGTRCRQADSAPELSPFHADPVSRAIRSWCQSEPSSRRPVGVAPDPSALHHCPVSVLRPEGRHSVRSPRRLVRFPERPCRSPWPLAPRRDHATRLDLTPRPVARIRCRLSVVRVSPEGAVRTRSEVAVNSVLSEPAVSRERCGSSRGSVLTAPVGMRSPEQGPVKTRRYQWSRGFPKDTGLSPNLFCYPQFCLGCPRVAHRSCTPMSTCCTRVIRQAVAKRAAGRLNRRHGSTCRTIGRGV